MAKGGGLVGSWCQLVQKVKECDKEKVAMDSVNSKLLGAVQNTCKHVAEQKIS